jgi:hypothetical protein
VDNTAPAPDLLRITNAGGTAIVVVNPRNGDTFWYQYKDGLFEEFIVRVAVGDEVWQADLDAMRGFYAGYADIVLHIVETIDIAPPPTPTPPPTETPTPLPVETATVVASGLSAVSLPRPPSPKDSFFALSPTQDRETGSFSRGQPPRGFSRRRRASSATGRR